MAQDGTTAGGSSYTIDNVTFPVGRTKLQSIFDAIRSTNIGNTAPDLVAGQFWIDNNTPSTTVWTLYFYDGTDNISFATIDTINNTVNFLDSTFDLINDTTPQLGGNLDLNSNDITGTGNINITGTIQSSGNITGTLATASQPNITSVGTLTSFTSTGIDDNATSTAITIDSSERVGIGTSSPNTLLELSANNTSILVNSSPLNILRFNDEDGSTSGGNQPTGRIEFYVNDIGVGGTGIGSYLEGNADGSTGGGLLRFATSNNGVTGATERMRITGSGKVGIGTASPVGKLHIQSSASDQIYLNGTSGDAFGLWVNDTGTGFSLGTWGVGERIIIDNSGNTLQFQTGGSERMRITSDGKIGIGTTSPNGSDFGSLTGLVHIKDLGGNNTGVKLEHGVGKSFWYQNATDTYFGSGSSNALRIYTGFTERMRIDSSGKVGIGTTAPQSPLHVIGTNETASLSLTGGASNSSVTQINAVNATATVWNILEIRGQQINFDTVSLERMRIDSSGKVGIGTTAPQEKLDIETPTGLASETGLKIRNGTAVNDVMAQIKLQGGYASTSNEGTAIISGGREGSGSGSKITFSTRISGGGLPATERMRIDTSGDVLVATTTNGSKAKLHAEGSMGIGAERFDTHEIGKGASGTFTTITTTFTTTSSVGSVIVEALMTGFSGVYLDHVIGKYSTQANAVMRNNASGGTTVTLTESSSVYTHTITTSVTHPVIKYKITVGGLAFFTVAPTITFA